MGNDAQPTTLEEALALRARAKFAQNPESARSSPTRFVAPGLATLAG